MNSLHSPSNHSAHTVCAFPFIRCSFHLWHNSMFLDNVNSAKVYVCLVPQCYYAPFTFLENMNTIYKFSCILL